MESPPRNRTTGSRAERELVVRARTDPDAFAELYRRYVDRIHGFAYRRTGSREVAEDVTAATFERALRSLHRFHWRDGGFAPWLFRIASNEIADHHRAEGRARSERARAASHALGPAAAADELDRVEHGDTIDELLAALDELNPRYQQAITLRYLSDLSNEEAAAAMGCSRPAMAVTLHRALAALRRALAGTAPTGGGGR